MYFVGEWKLIYTRLQVRATYSSEKLEADADERVLSVALVEEPVLVLEAVQDSVEAGVDGISEAEEGELVAVDEGGEDSEVAGGESGGGGGEEGADRGGRTRSCWSARGVGDGGQLACGWWE